MRYPESSRPQPSVAMGDGACHQCGEPVGVSASFCDRCGVRVPNTEVAGSRARPAPEMWKRFLYPAIGVVLGLFVGAIANLAVTEFIVTMSGAETISDMSEGWRALRSLITVSASIACMVIGFKTGSKAARA